MGTSYDVMKWDLRRLSHTTEKIPSRKVRMFAVINCSRSTYHHFGLREQPEQLVGFVVEILG